MTGASHMASPFNTLFRALLSSDVYGDCDVTVRRMVGDRVFVEMGFAPLERSTTLLHFQHYRDDGGIDEIIARTEVMGWHVMGWHDDGVRIVELRIVDFAQTQDNIDPAHIH